MHASRKFVEVFGPLVLVLAGCGEGVVEPAIATEASAVGALPDRILDQSDGSAAVEAYDNFGAVVATGDFNGDNVDDLAVAAPYEDFGATDAGHVIVFYGGSGGPGSGGTEWLSQSTAGQTNEADDRFGAALAVGKFDGDDIDDLAVGVPGQTIDGRAEAGMVIVFYGHQGGLDVRGPHAFSQRSVSGATPEANDHFGAVLAAGNFDGQGGDDLAIGVPDEGLSGLASAGAVVVMYGRTLGILPPMSEVLRRRHTSAGSDQAGAEFGFALAAGRFDGDAIDDLAVGAPGETLGVADEGAVHLFRGALSGLLPANTQQLTQVSLGIQPSRSERFGAVLAAGDFDSGGFDDLAVGVPDKDNGGANSGGVVVVYGDTNGFAAVPHMLTQRTAGGANEAGDRFGAALTTGDFDDDGFADLVAGVPFESVEGVSNNGAIMAFFGGAAGVLPARAYYLTQRVFGGAEEPIDGFGFALTAGDYNGGAGGDWVAVGVPFEDIGAVPNAGAVFVGELEPALPDVTARAAIVVEAATGRVLGAKQADLRRPMASTTKMMTALLVLLDIDAGRYDWSDQFIISPNAAGMTGSRMGLSTWDRVSVEDLLMGLMLESGNDAAVALAEVAHGWGNEDIFVMRMNFMARVLDMNDTRFANPHGRDVCPTFDITDPACDHYSTPRDLARLARVAMQTPGFAGLVNQPTYVPRDWYQAGGRGGQITTLLCSSNRFLHDGSVAACGDTGGRFDPDYYGIKTGRTDQAGRCLVAGSDDGTRDLISVVMGADVRYGDTVDIMSWGRAAP